MCIRSAFITDIVAAIAAADPAFYDDDFARDATVALLALPSKAIGHPFSVAGALIKADLFIKDDFGHVVSTVGRACRGYARFLRTQGDLFGGMPAAPVKAARKLKPLKPRGHIAAGAKKRRQPRNLTLARKHRRPAKHLPINAMQRAALAEYAAVIAASPPALPRPRDLGYNVVDLVALRAARAQA